MNLALHGFGVSQPTFSIAQAEAAEIAGTFSGLPPDRVGSLQALYRRTRIERRGSVLLEQPAGCEPRQTFMPPACDSLDQGPTTDARMQRYAADAPLLALAAAREALECAEVFAREITHLITISCTGFAAPGIDIRLIKSLRLPRSVARTHVGFMGCHGALNGLRVAAALAGTRRHARVLLCATELCSLHYQYGPAAENLVANAIFADGAGAVVCGRPRAATEWRLTRSGSCLFPNSEDAMSWRVGDHGFEMRLSARVPELIARHLRPWLETWLAKAGLSLAAIGSWAIHPGGPRILEQVAAALDLPRSATEDSARVLTECGNMSSPTVLFILERLWRQAARLPCVALAFGPGLAAEAALFQ